MRNDRKFEKEVSEYKERLVYINRVAKVVKGGKNFRFTALMVVGNEKGKVGVGLGKAVEIPEAVRKGVEDAKRHMIEIPLVGTSIPHEVEGKFGKGHCACSPLKKVPALSQAAPSVRYWKWQVSRISAPSPTVPTTPATA